MMLASVLLAAAGPGAIAPPAHAMRAFPSIVDRVVGAPFDVAPARASLGDESAAWRVEFADAELYGVAQLRSSGSRVSGRWRSCIANAALVHVGSSVGSQSRATVEAGVAIRGAWQGAIRAGIARVALDTYGASTWRIAGVVSRVDVGRASLLADVEAVDGPGGYDTSLALASRVRVGAAQMIGRLRVDGDRFAGAGIAVLARMHARLSLLAGYDDGAQSLCAGALVHWRSFEVSTGIEQHPVLGMTQSVSVACVR